LWESSIQKDLEENVKVCSSCGKYFRMNAKERLELIIDTGTFRELDTDIKTVNPLDFEDMKIK
jgi:acetyl-CoA carboxylase carboxyl transferase subunit beta